MNTYQLIKNLSTFTYTYLFTKSSILKINIFNNYFKNNI